jgi:hypothetical protein
VLAKLANGPSSVSPASSKRISGNVEKNIEVALDIEEIAYEVIESSMRSA